MVAVWGNKWCSHLEDEQLKITTAIWKTATQNLTDEQMTAGIMKCCAIMDFPPSIAQFKRAALGIVSADRAYNLSQGDPVADHAWMLVDPWLKKTGSEKEVKSAFISIYNNLAEELLCGRE